MSYFLNEAIDGRKTSGGCLLCADRSEAETRSRNAGEWLLFAPTTKKDILSDILFVVRAIDGARTRGLDLGKVARYQLRHYRICTCLSAHRLLYVYYQSLFALSTFISIFLFYYRANFWRHRF